MAVKLAKPEQFSLKDHPELNEKWVQERIAEDPAILGLGDVVLRDAERRQPHAGRLDLLLQDTDSARRYEVEIQLGKTDESHIIRTIEYWDIERRRYPQYDHCAVVVAEDITSRFLNVISLFNGHIPIVALQMTALKWNDEVALLFTRVVDELTLGLDDEDEDVRAAADRAYWENRATPETMRLVDKLFELTKAVEPNIEPKYNRYYVGLARNGQTDNFVLYRPRKKNVYLELRLARADDIEEELERAGLGLLDYDKRWGKYRVRITADDLKRHAELLSSLIRRAAGESG